MQTHSIIALAGSVIIAAASIAGFAHSTRPPAYDISLAPSVIDDVSVHNLPTVMVTGQINAARPASARRHPLSLSGLNCASPRTLASLHHVMPYYSFARSLRTL